MRLLNVMHDPRLDPGPEETIIIKDIIAEIHEIGIWDLD